MMNLLFIYLFFSYLNLHSCLSEFLMNSFPITQLQVGITCHTHVMVEKGFSFEVILTTPHTIYKGPKPPKPIPLSNVKGLSCILLIVATISRQVRPTLFVSESLRRYSITFAGYPHMIKNKYSRVQSWRLEYSYVNPRLTRQTVALILTTGPFETLAKDFEYKQDEITLYKFFIFVNCTNETPDNQIYLACLSCGEKLPFRMKYPEEKKFSLNTAME